MASNISSASFRMPFFRGTQDQAKTQIKKIRLGLMDMNPAEQERMVNLEQIDRSRTTFSFRMSSFSQPEERRIQIASYLNSLIDAAYPTYTEKQQEIKRVFANYLKGTVEIEGKEKNSNDISGKELLTYLNNLYLARLDVEANEAELSPVASPFAADQPQKIEENLHDFLKSKEVVIHMNSCIGEGTFGVVKSARVKGEEGKYVYKKEKRDVSSALTARGSSFWREGDCAAARLHDISNVPKPLFFIFGISQEEKPEEFHYVPANHVKAFGMRLSRGAEVFLEGQLMERAPGESLDKIILRKEMLFSPITGTHFTSVVRGLFNIMQELQAHNLVHRDIKPENIFYNLLTQEVTLLDFGSATKLRKKEKADDRSHFYQPTSTELGGTRKYISPRVLQQNSYGSEVDLFSFAMTVLELVNHDNFMKFVHQRFPNVLQKDMGDDLFATCPPTEYLNRFLEAIRDKKPEPLSASLPAEPSFISSLFGWSGSGDVLSAGRRSRAQSFGFSASSGDSKIERALSRNSDLKQIIDLAFRASGGGPEGAAAYEQLKALPYFQTQSSPSTINSPTTRASAQTPHSSNLTSTSSSNFKLSRG